MLSEVLGRHLKSHRVQILDEREERGVPGRDLPNGLLLALGSLLNCLLDGQEYLVNSNDWEVVVLSRSVASLTIKSLRLVTLVASFLLTQKDNFC